MISGTDKNKIKAGYKQTLKAIDSDVAKKVYLASDCDGRMSGPVLNAAASKNIEVVRIETMKELGKLCGIDRGASCAVQTD